MRENFDPYFDWDLITEEIAADLQMAMRRYYGFARDLANAREPDVELARAVLESHDELDDVVVAIKRHCYRQPMMVHISDEPQMEDNNEDGPSEVLVQRCQRCKSVLHFWHEGMMILTPGGPHELQTDEVPWWPKDTIVAKHNTEDGGVGMYEIEANRDLDSHELECVGIPNLR